MITLVYGLHPTNEDEHDKQSFETRREATLWRKANLFSGVCWWIFDARNRCVDKGVQR